MVTHRPQKTTSKVFGARVGSVILELLKQGTMSSPHSILSIRPPGSRGLGADESQATP